MRPFRPAQGFSVAIAALESEALGAVARAFAERLGDALEALGAAAPGSTSPA